MDTIPAQQIIETATPSLKQQLATQDSLLAFVKSLDSASYKHWSQPNDTITSLVYSLYKDHIPDSAAIAIKEIRFVQHAVDLHIGIQFNGRVFELTFALCVAFCSEMGERSESTALARAMREAGPSCCNSTSSVEDLLRQAGYNNESGPSERDVARVLAMMISRQDGSGVGNSWDFKTFASSLSNYSIDWVSVIRALDYPGFRVIDASGFEFIVNAFRDTGKVLFKFPSLPYIVDA